MSRPARHRWAAWLLAFAGASTQAGIAIEPVAIQLEQSSRSATIRITNQGDRSVRFQAAAFRWTQTGADRTEPSDELLVVPPMADIAPGARQLFRVALRRPQPSPRERAFRVQLEDISPSPAATGDGAQAAIRLTHDLPVLVAPVGPPVRAITWADCGAAGAAPPGPAPTSPCLRLTNQGNLRFKFDAITLTGPNGERRVALPAAQNLLAGSFLDLPLPADVPPLRSTRAVLVHAAQGDPVQAQAAPAP